MRTKGEHVKQPRQQPELRNKPRTTLGVRQQRNLPLCKLLKFKTQNDSTPYGHYNNTNVHRYNIKIIMSNGSPKALHVNLKHTMSWTI